MGSNKLSFAKMTRGPDSDLTMPFGKHRGTLIEDIDTSYLQWAVTKATSPYLRERIAEVLIERGQQVPDPISDPPTPAEPRITGSAKLIFIAELRTLMKSWFGQMSKTYHPDRGGKDGQQEVVIACYKALVKALEDWEARP